MKNFLIYTMATITGIVIISLLFFFMLIGSLSVMVAAGNKPVTISGNSILVLNAGVAIPDRTNPNPFAGFDIINGTTTQVTGLNDILKNLNKAALDSKIRGILIENGVSPSGWGTTEELRDALLKFKEESGKFVIAYSDYIMEQQGYYLSTAANSIYINPSSMIDFKGLSGEVMFYKKALDKVGIEVQVIRHGKFKGAVEPYILDHLSDENRLQIKEYVGSLWNYAVEGISEARHISVDSVNLLADNLAGNLSSTALASRLVDGVLYRDQLNDSLKSLSGLGQNDKINFVSMNSYSRVTETSKITYTKNHIAVIYASGTIVMGRGRDNNIGGNKFAELIRDERLDTSVKAIVLRVNSPGGNAVASDIMWRELKLASGVKPVVISMGNLAASGGYYISAPASKIYSDPTTISGSIGVFGMIPNAGKLMEDKLGITTETVNTNANSDFPNLFRPLNTYEKQAMQLSIEKIYGDFVSKVADGRGMNETTVDSIGQGRVWSGVDGQKIGLIDEIGGLEDAVKGAASLAGIEHYAIRELPEPEDAYTRILNQLGMDVKARIISRELGESYRIYNELSELKDLTGIQMRLPYLIEIH